MTAVCDTHWQCRYAVSKPNIFRHQQHPRLYPSTQAAHGHPGQVETCPHLSEKSSPHLHLCTLRSDVHGHSHALDLASGSWPLLDRRPKRALAMEVAIFIPSHVFPQRATPRAQKGTGFVTQCVGSTVSTLCGIAWVMIPGTEAAAGHMGCEICNALSLRKPADLSYRGVCISELQPSLVVVKRGVQAERRGHPPNTPSHCRTMALQKRCLAFLL